MYTKTVPVCSYSTVYVAVDGQQFNSKEECKAHEKQIKKHLENINKYAVEIDSIPLSTEYFSDMDTYTWFKVNNEEELDDLSDHIGYCFATPNSYPAYFCVETEGEFDGDVPDYVYSLESMMEEAKWFFEMFGYDIEFKSK